MRTKILQILLVLFFIPFFGLSQNSNGRQGCNMDDDKIRAEKVSFITDKLNLSVKEAQEFWPVYNELDQKLNELFLEEHKLMRELHKDVETLSDKEIVSKLDRIFGLKQERSKIENEYYNKFKNVLPIQKVAKLYQTEKDFRRYLLEKYKKEKVSPGN